MKKYNITVNGKKYEVEVEETDQHLKTPAPAVDSKLASMSVDRPVAAEPKSSSSPAPVRTADPVNPTDMSASEGSVKVTSPMPGTILKVNVSVGQKVSKGDVLCVLEAMKMENDIVSPDDGTVAGMSVSKGSSVNAGDLLVSLN